MGVTTVERCYDAIPRPSAEAEEVGPFTLFVARPGVTWTLYARPRLGVTEVAPDDVRRLLARQDELGVPRALEWVDEVTPALTAAVRAVAADTQVQVVPLLTADPATVAPPDRARVLPPDDPDLPLALGVVGAASRPPNPALIEAGDLVVVAGYDAAGRLVGGGSAAPRGDAAELMGIATLPSSRGRGVAGDVTRALVAAVRGRGVTTVFLTAASDAAAGVYRRVGFERVGTGLIADLSGVSLG